MHYVFKLMVAKRRTVDKNNFITDIITKNGNLKFENIDKNT